MTAARQEIRGKRSGPLNNKQYKIWIDVLNTDKWIDISTLADKHNYTNREVTTAIGRMPTPPIVFEDGAIRFEGTQEDRDYYRRVLTAERYSITGDLCDVVKRVMTAEWMTVSSLADLTGMPPIMISRTLVVMGDVVSKKSTANGVFYKLETPESGL